MITPWTFQLCHTLMEGNMCADFLAMHKTKTTDDRLVVLNRLAKLRLLLTADNMDVVYHRSR